MPESELPTELDPKIAAAFDRAIAALRAEIDDKIAAARRDLGLQSPEAGGADSVAAESPPASGEAISSATSFAAEPSGTVEELKLALALIDRAGSQAEVLSALLGGARRFSSRAALFLVRPEVLEWWDGQGFQSSGKPLSAFEVPRAPDGPWDRLARGEGTVALDASECGAICDALDVERPTVGAVLPFVLGDQVAAGLYCDRLSDDPSLELSALQILTFSAAQTLETLPLRKRERTATLRLAAGSPTAPAADAGRGAVGALEPEATPEPPTSTSDDGYRSSTAATTDEATELSPDVTAEEAEFELEEAPDTVPAATDASAEDLWGPPSDAPAGDDRPSEPEAGDPTEATVSSAGPESPPIGPPPSSPTEPPRASVADSVTEELPELPDLPEPPARAVPGLYTPGLETTEILPVGPAEPSRPVEEAPVEEPPVEEAPKLAEPRRPAGFEAAPPAEEGTRPGIDTPPAPAEEEKPAAVDAARTVESRATTEVAAPDDLEGPGWAFSADDISTEVGENERQEEAQRLARLLCTEIKLYNEEQVEEGRREGDLHVRLREDIDRSRQIYNDRIDTSVREERDYFREALVRILAGGDESLIAT